MAFKIAGSMAFKEAMEKAKPVLLEPIMHVTVSVPEDSRGRRHRRPQLPPRAPAGHGAQGRDDRGQGRGADGRDAHLRARPAAITGGQGEYTMELARYEEVPAHIAQSVVQEVQREAEAVEQTKHDWIFSLDADERVSDELKTSIDSLRLKTDLADGYRFRVALATKTLDPWRRLVSRSTVTTLQERQGSVETTSHSRIRDDGSGRARRKTQRRSIALHFTKRRPSSPHDRRALRTFGCAPDV